MLRSPSLPLTSFTLRPFRMLREVRTPSGVLREAAGQALNPRVCTPNIYSGLQARVLILLGNKNFD